MVGALVGFSFLALVLLTLSIEFYFFLYSGEWESFRLHHLLTLLNLKVDIYKTQALGFRKIVLWALDLKLWGLFVWGGLLSFLAGIGEKDW